jgi:DNA-binding transcriptional ArsR family regulator
MAPSSSELISAVEHPLRRQILFAYLEGDYEGASAAEVAAALDEPVSQVAYHLKTLAKCGVLGPIEGNGRRGPEPRYLLAPGVDSQWLRLVLEVWIESGVRR